MATTEFLPFATGGGANVESQGAFAGSTHQTQGFSSGIAPSASFNKVWRQSSMMASAWAQFCVSLGISVPDDGNLSNLQANLQSALVAFLAANGVGFTTGDMKPTLKTTADPTWIMMNDGSIGDASSGATARANGDTINLFTLIWNNITNTNAPTQDSTGTPIARGASAAIDFAAHRRIVLTKTLGRAIFAAGSGAGLTVRNLGDSAGAESVAFGTANLPAGTELVTGTTVTGIGGGSGGLNVSSAYSAAGAGTLLPTMPPAAFVNIMCKL